MREPGRERVGIVLSAAPYAEADRIVRVLIAEEGQVGAFQRGGQKRPAGLDLGVRAGLQLRARPGGLDTLIGAAVEDARVHLRRSYGRLVMAQYACELAGAFSREGHAEPKLFGLLETVLLLLDAMEGEPGPALLAALELKMLTFAGLGPALDRCAVCGDEPEAMMHFDPIGGGARHDRCGGGAPIARETLAILEDLRRRPMREAVDREIPAEVEPFAAEVLRAQLGREPGARALLAGLW